MMRRTSSFIGRLRGLGWGLLLATAVAVAQPAPTPGTLTDLGPNAPGVAINNAGTVVLSRSVYSGGTLTALPAQFFARAISSDGRIGGSYGTNCGFAGFDAGFACAMAAYAGGNLTVYPINDGSLDPAVGNLGLGINASGTIVGNETMPHGQGGALLLSNGVFSTLALPNSICSGNIAVLLGIAYAINDAGQVAGEAPYQTDGAAQGCASHAFLQSQSVFHDLGPGTAYALNASGETVGELYPFIGNQDYRAHAFYFILGVTPAAVDIGTLPGYAYSTAYAVNSQGLLAGSSYSSYPVSQMGRAFLFNGVMLELNALVQSSDPLHGAVTLTQAAAINDSGTVVVNGVDNATQVAHAYLLQVPLVQVAPGPLAFASQAAGTVSASQTLTFTNVGASPVVLGAASISGNFLIQSNGCAMSLGAAASCTIAVSYAPVAGGSATGSLTLVAGGVPLPVPLGPSAVTISASAATANVGAPVTLTWSAPSGASCTATGGSAADGWSGALGASGTQSVQESAPGTYSYGLSCIVGSQMQTATVSPAVVVAYPPVTVTLTASPTSVAAGHAATLTWTSTQATSCTAGGGGANDGWPGARATSGSLAVTEPYALTVPALNVTYTLTCTSSVSGLSASASAVVEQVAPKGSGGGSLEPVSLLGLLALAAVRVAAARGRRPLR